MIRIPLSVAVFAKGDTSFYELMPDYINHYRAEHGANVSYDKTLTFAEKSQAMHVELLKEIKRQANMPNTNEEFALESQVSHPSFQWAAFAVIDAAIEIIIPETIIDSIGVYSDVRTIGYGDSASFEVKPRDLFAVTKSSLGKRVTEIQQQFDGQVTLVPVDLVTVGVSLYRVLTGMENLAEFVMKAARSIETQMAYDAYYAMNTAMTALPTTPSGGELKFTGYAQADAIQLAQAVTAFNGGNQAVFAGTKAALASILPNDANYRYDLQSDYVKIGYVRTAFGYDTMAFPQVADWATPFKLLLADDRIYVVSPSSQKLIKVVIGGATLAIPAGTFQNANLMQTTTLHKKWIAGVATNSVAGLITL